MSGILIKILLIIISLLTALHIAPYLISVKKPETGVKTPFENSTFINADRVSLHLRVWQPQGSVCRGRVLLVHGFGGSTYTWRNTMEALQAQNYIAVAVDLPGFGYSSRNRGINHSQQNRGLLLWDLIDVLEISLLKGKESWHLVGHSIGAGVITAMALEKRERVRSLILVDGAILNKISRMHMLAKYQPLGRWVQVMAERFLLTKKRTKRLLSLSYGCVPDDKDVKAYWEPLILDGTGGALVDIITTSRNIIKERLYGLDVPAYAISGEKDTLIPPGQAYLLKEILPALSIFIIPGAYHCPMETHSGLFNERLLNIMLSMDEYAKPVD